MKEAFVFNGKECRSVVTLAFSILDACQKLLEFECNDGRKGEIHSIQKIEDCSWKWTVVAHFCLTHYDEDGKWSGTSEFDRTYEVHSFEFVD